MVHHFTTRALRALFAGFRLPNATPHVSSLRELLIGLDSDRFSLRDFFCQCLPSFAFLSAESSLISERRCVLSCFRLYVVVLYIKLCCLQLHGPQVLGRYTVRTL
eukprot:GILJ01027548.1.p1 GENE.GILJ01027548.1~~GILJ01027548.1.p1  ORF type:complete len:105 (+),score=3.32 GILJ01027548.1:104-418(+)